VSSSSSHSGIRRPRALIAAFVAIALAVLLAACGSDSETPVNGGDSAGGGGGDASTLTIGVSSDPQTLDPEFGQAPRANETLKNIYSQWTRYERVDAGDGDFRADLSKPPVGLALDSYRVSRDGRTVTLTARDGFRLPTSGQLTAEDLKFKTERLLGMNAASAFDLIILGVTRDSQVRVVDDRTIELSLPQPSPIIGPMLRDQDAGLLDTELVRRNATAEDRWARSFVGRTGAPTGAYLIEEYLPGNQLVLRANPGYPERPNFERVVLKVIPSADERAQLLRNGTIDVATELTTDGIVRLRDSDGVRVVSVPSLAQAQLGLVMDKPPFDDVRVRQAIAAAVPYDSLAENVYSGEGAASRGVWPSQSVWFDRDGVNPYVTDPERARRLLAEAGAENLSFDVEISDADADAEALAIPVQTALADVGVTMNIRRLNAAQFQENLGRRSAQAWIQSSIAPYVDDPHYIAFLSWTTRSPINWYGYSNPVVDRAGAELAVTLDEAKRRELANTIQRQLAADVPMISLGEPNYLLPVREDIRGVLWEPDGLLTYGLLRREG
jgi:peptide/nickel transport system substrate-binding protein